MAKLNSLTLEELYARPKITPAVRQAIMLKTDFGELNELYCDKVCTLKCKRPENVVLRHDPVDILIIQDHKAPRGKFDKRDDGQELVQDGVIQFIAKQAGLTDYRYRVLDLLKCDASAQDFPAGKPPTETTLRKCFPYLAEEIRRSKPKVVISLATAVTKALGLTKHSNTGNRGEVAITEDGILVVMTLHPRILTMIRQNARGSAGMWGPDYLPVIQRDFEKARKLVSGEVHYHKDTRKEAVAELKAKYIHVAKTLEEVQGILATINALPENRIISFDTETTSLDVLSPDMKLLTIQFGWRGDDGHIYAGVIPLWHRRNTFYDPDEAWKLVVPLLLGERRKVGHNSKYDILAIYWSTGVRVQNVAFDTLLLIHSIYSGVQGCYGLKAATWDWLFEMGIGGYEDDLGDLKALKKQIEMAQGQQDPDELQGEIYIE